MAYVISNPRLGFQPIAVTSTTLNSPLGTRVMAVDPTYGEGEFIYLLGVASTAVGSWVLYNQDAYSTSLATANDEGAIAVAMSANVASSYGWYQIRGKAVGKALAGFADNADVYLTSTAGSVDDAVVSGDKIFNAKGASAVGTPSSGLAEFEIDLPSCTNGKILDSTEVTSSGAELNIMDGVTSTAAEINYLDLTTGPGTQEASKAVVADANVNTGISKVTELHIGASGSETQVNATAAEINAAADVSVRSEAVTTANVITAAESGKTFFLNSATGFASTLPAPAAGLEFRFIVTTQPTSGNHTVVTNASANVIEGMADVNSTLVLAANEDSINFVASTTIVGDWVYVYSDGTSWFVTGQSGAVGGITFTAA